MSKAYGFIEITGVVAAINALDIMCKTADVELASWERKLGGRLVTLIVEGDVSAVTEAVDAAVANAIKKPASYAVIARPHEEIVKMGDGAVEMLDRATVGKQHREAECGEFVAGCYVATAVYQFPQEYTGATEEQLKFENTIVFALDVAEAPVNDSSRCGHR